MSGPAEFSDERRIPDEHRQPEYTEHDTERFVVEAAKTAGLSMAGAVSGRTPFGRDRARVLHSSSFRRLAGKTQVVAPDEDDVPRTRLTHSLEVAQIARDIGTQLGCDADLVDLAGLAHDIGHPPFGHNGETALDAIGGPAGGFEANAQNLRLLTRLELKVIAPDGRLAGLNLTRASLDAVVKYPWRRPAGGGKFGVYADDQPVFDWMRSGIPCSPDGCPDGSATRRSLEAQVMDWADDVAYSVHDVEDGVGSGRIDLATIALPDERAAVAAAAAAYSGESEADLDTVLADLLALPAVAAGLAVSGPTAGAALKSVTSELTGRFVTGAVAATRAESGEEPLLRYACDLRVPRLLRAEVALLKAVALRYVMADPERRVIQEREQEMLTELVQVMADRGAEVLDPLFAHRYGEASGDADRLRVVLDQVSLLTDAQAIARHRQLTR
ncbi:dGTPase [Nakamurella sp. UYEF19]|uniref:deoxyguanosinetriphosphate triphosphohydrolase n=1 Tax=Nakamurella sp. UYEF19 TaxID=1756392 RepID=UPI003397255B